MELDLRWPMGALFTLIGVILTIHGAVSDRALYARSLGINVDLIWGCVLLVFGLLMLALAWRARPASPPQ
jgi:protein-S-isoprenylcysteine O-methyltransferase Ste14